MRRALLTSLLTLALNGPALALEMLVFTNPGLFEQAADGRITGPGGDMLSRISAVSGVDFKVQVMPAARVMQTLVQQPGSCAAGVPRLPDNESQLRWLGLLASAPMMLYGRNDETRIVADVNDLRHAVVAATRNSRPAAWLREQGVAMQEVRDTVTGLRMLQARRVDFWLVNDLAAQPVVQPHSGELLARPLQNFGLIKAFLACHRDTPPAEMEKMRLAVEQMRRDGELTVFGVRPE